eukprot:5514914-Lingulodinium_polyedra.AAC.1
MAPNAGNGGGPPALQTMQTNPPARGTPKRAAELNGTRTPRCLAAAGLRPDRGATNEAQLNTAS